MSGEPPLTVAITGGASGLGRETARQLARQGAELVLVGRDPAHLEETRTLIAREVGREVVSTVRTRDLAELSEMRRVADELARDHPSVNVLVNNAGALFGRRNVTADGLERTFALNVLAPFVLSTRLAPVLSKNRPARIVNLASAAHRMQKLDLEDLQLTARYRGYRAYARSKLAVILLTRELARRFGPGGVTVLAVHPGFVRTHFGQNNPGAYGAGFRWATRLFAISVRRGAQVPVRAASDPSLASAGGTYFDRRGPRSGSTVSQDLGLARRLFDRCAELAGSGVPVEPGSGGRPSGAAATG